MKTGTVYPVHKIHNNFYVTRFLFMICLILAAGYATRLYPLTENFPKPLLDVQGRTVLDWLLSDVDCIEGIEKYVVISNHKFYDHFIAWKESCSLSHPVIVLDDGSTDNSNRLGAVKDIVDSIAIFGISSIPIFRIGKDMVFPPFGKRYFQNVTEFSGLLVTW